MIKRILLTVAVALGTMSIQVQASPVEYGNRNFYGFFLGNGQYTNASELKYGFGRQTFASPRSNELIYEIGDNVGVYSAAAIDGLFYAIPYRFESSLSMPEPMPVMTYNIYTGQFAELGQWNPEGTLFKTQDMTYDVANDRLLALGFDPEGVGGSAIYEVDRKTGAMKCINELPVTVTGGALASDAHGRLFMMSNDGALYQVHEGTVEKLYQLPFCGMTSNQTMEFDLTCNKLYWAAATRENPAGYDSGETWLVEITMPIIGPGQNYTASSGSYSYNVVDAIGYTSRFLGMYIPYCGGGFSAPGFATDVSARSNEDGSECTVTFTTPVKCFNGVDDTTVDGYDIYRDGVCIYTAGGVHAGETVSYTDKTIPASGTYRYDIVCYSNEGGNGPKTPLYTYVGYDRPAGVIVNSLYTSDDFLSVVIEWDAPQEGAQGGTFYPADTKYDIKRLPDNVQVATDLTTTSFEDNNLRRLLKYTYCITAKNQYGSTTVNTAPIVAGPPYSSLPLEETFENPTAFNNRWTSLDYNEDTFTWLYGSDLGGAVFGDYEMAAEYIISPTLDVESIKDADEWIITPPIVFEEGGNYKVSFGIRSLTNEIFNVCVGTKPDVDEMKKIDSFTLKEPVYNDDGRMQFQTYDVNLPEDVGGTIACVALQLATPVPDNFYSYVQVGSFTVSDGTAGIGKVVVGDDEVALTRVGDVVTINGAFAMAALYSVNGVKLLNVSGDTVDLCSFDRGIYILVVDGRGYKLKK